MKIQLLIVVLAAAMLAGCASAPPTSHALSKAEMEINQAADNPAVMENAPVTLKKAQEALSKAKHANTSEDADMWSYIATRRAQIAEAQARKARAAKTIKDAKAERKRILKNARKQKLEKKNQQIQELKSKLSNLHPHRTDQGIMLTLGDVLFAFDSADLRPGASSTLDSIATFLQKHGNDRVKIVGYTDSKGPAPYNMKLSRRRALSVKNGLVTRGVNAARLTTAGRGENNPVATNSTQTGRQKNRRVEFTIITPNQSGSSGGESVQ